jgi:hypothetical protein
MRLLAKPTLTPWPAIAVALIGGLLEWFALSRSRGADLLHAARRGLKRG